MEAESELEEDLRERYEELCQDLNLDSTTKTEAFQAYQKTSENYTLEGDPLHWLACALYVTCRRKVVPSVGGGDIEGNCVSLTRLIRSAKLSLLHFFSKIKKWSDMANLPKEFRDKVDRLERNFAVSTCIFKKFTPVFKTVFLDPANDLPRLPRSRKQRPRPCLPGELYQLTWKIFVQVKGHFPAISDDLINSYHLLLCVIDWMFGNAVLAKREDLLNPNFEGIPESTSNCGRGATSLLPGINDSPCIMELLCEKHEGLVVEAKTIKEHYFRPHIRKLLERKVLKGNKADVLAGVLDTSNFEDNCKAVDKAYEEYVLTVGDFDERIFLDKDADEEIGTPAKGCNNDIGVGSAEMGQLSRGGGNVLSSRPCSLQQHIEKTRTLAPSTPLTGRRYLPVQDPCVTPISTATQGVSKLQSLLAGRKKGPSLVLADIFSECSRNPQPSIEERVRQMGDTFSRSYTQSVDDKPGPQGDFARKRLQLGESLYYKMLESIMLAEKRRLGGSKAIDLSSLLEQDIFHRSLFSCCLEVVIFSYNSQRTFPWIVDTFDIPAYHLYKVIELIIRCEEGFSRDVIKHLNRIEETILDSLAWKSGSPLWDAIEDLKEHHHTIPTCEEVAMPPSNPMAVTTSEELRSGLACGLSLSSPVVHPTVRRLAQSDGKLIIRKDGNMGVNSPLSPLRPSAADRFSSPVAGTAKRRLFTNVAGGGVSTVEACNSNGELATPTTPQHTQQMPFAQKIITFQQVQSNDGRSVLIPVHIVQNIPQQAEGKGSTTPGAASANFAARLGALTVIATTPGATATPAEAVRPRKTGSLALFFRKVYHLASVRLHDLCERLDIDESLRHKIWTCFEYCLVNETELLMDRHLDQFIVCAIYVMAKVVGKEESFQDIMKCYRLQPQAQSHVYRSVLLETKKRRTSGSSDSGKNATSRSSSPTFTEKEEKKRLDRLSSIRSSSTMPVPQPSSQPPTPTKVASAAASCFQFEDRISEERGDLIKFYNQVYVKSVKKFVVKFSAEEKSEAPPLSALPVVRHSQLSPRQVSRNHTVYISPHKATEQSLMTPTSRLLYCFNRSPAKDLRAINNMLRMGEKKSTLASATTPVTISGGGGASAQQSLLLQQAKGRDDSSHTATKRIRLEEAAGSCGGASSCSDSAVMQSKLLQLRQEQQQEAASAASTS